MSYREEQCAKAIELLQNGFFANDPGGGIIGVPRDFALQDSRLPLWSGIADDAILYFEANAIPWWKAAGEKSDRGMPSSHLLSSQAACVNHLYALRQRQDFAAAILQKIDLRIVSAEKIGKPDIEAGYVAFEIIGAKNYLGEKNHTRGALSTSVDAVMLGKKNGGKNILVLIEWKYTEEYITGDYNKNTGVDGQHRHDRYDPLLKEEDSPISVASFEALYYEPFYQLMRQTVLGWKMVEHNEYCCDEFVHIHVIPDGNLELLNNVTSPLLREHGNTISEAWKGVLKKPDKYQVISPEKLFEPLMNLPDARSLLEYLNARYWR
ncbi:PGN_0703 family putative restriction endonuclease [Treponema endosymbiont of Eucomonympha sp.]|uniref:PGN_0703 family putative restriction endonuclease n=1 Tax=Treponema endosymbiont of Eucomonympha sp. TaxID=1580831 RepID=UPI000A82F5C7|nr:hypothetical protein [Treponema endosymbiont of Eucomonympha sp.]